MRDVRRALGAGDQLAYELAELLIDVDDLVDDGVPRAAVGGDGSLPSEDDASEDDSEGAVDSRQLDLDGVQSVARHQVRGGVAGPAGRSSLRSDPAAGVRLPLGGLAGQPAQTEHAESEVRRDHLGAAVPGLNAAFGSRRECK